MSNEKSRFVHEILTGRHTQTDQLENRSQSSCEQQEEPMGGSSPEVKKHHRCVALVKVLKGSGASLEECDAVMKACMSGEGNFNEIDPLF